MSHHIPNKVGQPVEQGLHATDELHMFGLCYSLLDEENHKTGRDKGHGEDDANGHQHVHRCRHPKTQKVRIVDRENFRLRSYVKLIVMLTVPLVRAAPW